MTESGIFLPTAYISARATEQTNRGNCDCDKQDKKETRKETSCQKGK